MFPPVAARDVGITEFQEARHDRIDAAGPRRAVTTLAQSRQRRDERITGSGSIQNVVFGFLAQLPCVQDRRKSFEHARAIFKGADGFDDKRAGPDIAGVRGVEQSSGGDAQRFDRFRQIKIRRRFFSREDAEGQARVFADHARRHSPREKKRGGVGDIDLFALEQTHQCECGIRGLDALDAFHRPHFSRGGLLLQCGKKNRMTQVTEISPGPVGAEFVVLERFFV